MSRSVWIGIMGLLLGELFPLRGVGQTAFAPPAGIKNVILIIMDAVRADHLGIYGYGRNTSPHLDRIGREGVVFDRAIVQAGWTKSSIPSLFTATYPSVHRVLELDDTFCQGPVTMAGIFRDNGYFTQGLVNNIHISSRFGFDRGFDVYQLLGDDEIIDGVRCALTRGYVRPDLLSEEDVQRFRRFLEKKRGLDLVRDGGFEKKSGAWSGESKWLTSDPVNSGNYAVHVDKAAFPGVSFYHLNQRLKVKHGARYVFGAFVKTENLRDEVKVQIKDIHSPQPYPYYATDAISGDNSWTLLVGMFRPQGCDENYEAEISLQAGSLTNFQEGGFWIDDVFVIPLADLPERILLRRPQKLFFYLHFLGPHHPYLPPDVYLGHFADKDELSLLDRYDAEIRALDAKLGLLWEELTGWGLEEETLIIISADHGEALGEHGLWTHGRGFYYDEVARVPLIMHNLGLFPSPQRIPETVQASVDLLPSLIDLLKLKVHAGVRFQGKTFWGQGGSETPYAYFYQGPYVKMVTDSKWKYVSNEYYDFIDGRELRGIYWGDEGTGIEVISPEEEKKVICNTEEELRNSELFRSHNQRLQGEILRLWKAVVKKPAALFDIQSDPGEISNVIGVYPAVAQKFRGLIRERIAADRDFQNKVEVKGSKAQITDTMKREFRALGYLD